jgi:hypothetical protein
VDLARARFVGNSIKTRSVFCSDPAEKALSVRARIFDCGINKLANRCFSGRHRPAPVRLQSEAINPLESLRFLTWLGISWVRLRPGGGSSSSRSLDRLASQETPKAEFASDHEFAEYIGERRKIERRLSKVCSNRRQRRLRFVDDAVGERLKAEGHLDEDILEIGAMMVEFRTAPVRLRDRRY